MNIIFWTILFYLLYRFIFGFLIPVINASRQMRMKMRKMQEQMNNPKGDYKQGDSAQEQSTKTTQSSAAKGEYIDFEEVK